MHPAHRNSIFIENARVLERLAFAGGQFVLRLQAPQCAAQAVPGSFVHVRCDPQIPMRRPLSIMRADPAAGWIEVLFKVVGAGLRALAGAGRGAQLSVIGPIGQGFRPDAGRLRAVLIGGGVGIPPLVFLAERLATNPAPAWRPVAFLGSELPFPFEAGRTPAALAGVPAATDACMPLLEGLGVPSRLATLGGFAGCHAGYVTELAAAHLATLDAQALAATMLFACGPEPMLHAVARLAASLGVPCQVCLEEFMACGVGGCAGCAVPVRTEQGLAMKRVCVDGPVFDAAAVYPPA